MKVKCIDNDCYRNYLTYGKTYEVIRINECGDYYIINDECDDLWYRKSYFKTLSKYRNEIIDKLLSDEVTNVI